MTTVSAGMRRSYTAGMFDDLGLPAHTRTWDKATGVTTLTFAEALTSEQAEQVWARMESADDVDQAARASLRALRDATEDAPTPTTLEDALAQVGLLRSAVVGALTYWLGPTE